MSALRSSWHSFVNVSGEIVDWLDDAHTLLKECSQVEEIDEAEGYVNRHKVSGDGCTLYWRDASHNALDYRIGGCISQYIRLLYWRMHLTIHQTIVVEGCISQSIRLLYWRDASHNTLGYCIGGMPLTIH